MPKSSLQNLRDLIESSAELTPEHRAELLRATRDLEAEVHPIAGSESAAAGDLRTAIDLTGQLVRRKGSPPEDDLASKFEEAVDKVAIEHPTVAGFLTALGKLV